MTRYKMGNKKINQNVERIFSFMRYTLGLDKYNSKKVIKKLIKKIDKEDN